MIRLMKNKVIDELKDESGAGTAFALFFAAMSLAVGGLAIDASNAWSVKQRLQGATDVSAHAAALSLAYPGSAGMDGSISDIAIDALLVNMPESQFGVALQDTDVVVGYWDPTAKQLGKLSTDDSGNELLQAVSVTARLDGEVGNVVPTFILKLIGFDYWQISATSVFVRATPDCFDGGFIANGTVNIASNNDFTNGFCIHGNGGVDVNSNILFGSGVRVSMPNSALVEDGGMFALKGTGHTWEDGMSNQVADQWLQPSLATVASLEQTFADLADPTNLRTPSYITNKTVNKFSVLPNQPLSAGQLLPNAVNVIDCPNKGLDFPDNMTVENVVIIADCKVNFGQDALVRNAIIATTDTGNQSFNASASLQLGEDDSCADGGGVSLFTMGDAHFSAQTEWFGVELIAQGDAHISAKADGIEGVSIETGGDIFATSNLSFGACNEGIDHYRDLYIVRMVN